jgi:hypothetical protein
MSSAFQAVPSTSPDPVWRELLARYDRLDDACLIAWRAWVDAHKLGATPLSSELLTQYRTACSLRAAAERALMRHMHAGDARGREPVARREVAPLARSNRHARLFDASAQAPRR